MNYELTDEFINITKDILVNGHFNELKHEKHHGTNRYDHSLRVALSAYNYYKKKNHKDLVKITRAALLHDFYTNADLEFVNSVKALFVHPKMALKNARKYFDIDSLGEDIIVHHMFPLTIIPPKSLIAMKISLIDKVISTREQINYKFFKKKLMKKNGKTNKEKEMIRNIHYKLNLSFS